MNAVAFAVVLPTLLVAHTVGDHWVQTSHQAAAKGQPGTAGRVACAAHVASYTVVTSALVGLVWWVFGLQITAVGFVAGQVVSAATHYWADRRVTLEWLANWGPFGRIGKGEFYRFGQPRQVLGYDLSGEAVELRRTDGSRDGPGPWDNPSLGTGAYALDQSWHWAWLFVATLVTVM